MNVSKIIRFGVAAAVLTLVGFVCAVQAEQKQQDRKLSIGRRFHYETSITWRGILADMFQKKPRKPSQYKNYPDSNKVKLPEPDYKGLTVETAVRKRRSVRNYSKKPVTLSQLSQLLFAAGGVTGRMYGQLLRSSPSAGALYPFEIYTVINNVQDLPKGIYHYSALDHSLELVKAGDFTSKITDAGLEQDMLGQAGVTFILSAIFDRTRCKYGERGFRYVYIEAGHISQNIYLQSVSLGLGSVCVGAFVDEKVNQLIDIDGQNEAVIYLHAVGSL
ncbi:MAG: SagB/ThcOx family dehydrogenase [Planctomycetota bacterium]|jgi:SagB-type dehydrogenase family enzyme